MLFASLSTVSSGTPATPTISGNNLNWTQVTGLPIGPTGLLSLFRSVGVFPTTGPVTGTFGQQFQQGFAHAVFQFTGVGFEPGDTGVGAIIQISTTVGTGISGNFSCALNPFTSSGNVPVGIFGKTFSSNIFTTGAGYTGIYEQGVGNVGRLFCEWKSDSTSLAANTSWLGNETAAGIGLELQVALPNTGISVFGSEPAYQSGSMNISDFFVEPSSISASGGGSTTSRPTQGQIFPMGT